MKTVADPDVLRSLVARLEALTPGHQRRWGTLTAHEMVCHLGDANEMALRIRPRPDEVPLRRRPLLKWLGLWSPIRWPHGWRTNPHQNPKIDGTRPMSFDTDVLRVIHRLKDLAVADERTMERAHGVFGIMSVTDWQRWAYKHADHHLRQFGL